MAAPTRIQFAKSNFADDNLTAETASITWQAGNASSFSA